MVLYAESEKILWRWTCLEYDARYGVRKFENPRTPPPCLRACTLRQTKERSALRCDNLSILTVRVYCKIMATFNNVLALPCWYYAYVGMDLNTL